jgi:hypothetical protein
LTTPPTAFRTFPAFSAFGQRLMRLVFLGVLLGVLLGAVFGAVYAAGRAAAAHMPELRVSVGMGHGVLAPKLINFVGGS